MASLPNKPADSATAATPTTASTVAEPAVAAGPANPAASAGSAGYSYGSYNNTSYDAASGYDYSTYYANSAAGGSAGAAGYSSYGAAAGPSGYSSYSTSGAQYPAYDYSSAGYAGAGSYGTTDEELMAQQSIYTPENVEAKQTYVKKAQKGQARTTVLRKGGGEVWEDQTLMEWDPKHFRLFVGDLGNDVNEDDLVRAFGPDKGWTSFVKAKVVRDKVTNKTRGYGFVAYSDPEDFMKAWKAMNGKYVGSRPVKLQKATTQVRQVDIGQKKAKELDTKKKSHVIGNKVRGAVNPTGAWKPYIRR